MKSSCRLFYLNNWVSSHPHQCHLNRASVERIKSKEMWPVVHRCWLVHSLACFFKYSIFMCCKLISKLSNFLIISKFAWKYDWFLLWSQTFEPHWTYAWNSICVSLSHTHHQTNQLQNGRSYETPHPFLLQQSCVGRRSAVRWREWSCQRRGCKAGCRCFICSGGTAEVTGVKSLHLLTTTASHT